MSIVKEELICNKNIQITKKCILQLFIKLKTYETNKQYYHLVYNLNVNNKNDNPYYDDKEIFDNYSPGGLIYKNNITDVLIDHLMMTNTELKIDCNCDNPIDYRMSILKSLLLFWN